jgi:hypothetical protein
MTTPDEPFAARDPDFAAAIAASFARQGALQPIGAVLDSVSPGLCRVRVPYSDAATRAPGDGDPPPGRSNRGHSD